MTTGNADKRDVTKANSKPKARTENLLAPDQKEAARLLARETKQKEIDDRFASPRLVRAIEESFGKIHFDRCWHAASAARPTHYLDVRQRHNGLGVG